MTATSTSLSIGYTFVMPAKNVIISCDFAKKQTIKVTIVDTYQIPADKLEEFYDLLRNEEAALRQGLEIKEESHPADVIIIDPPKTEEAV